MLLLSLKRWLAALAAGVGRLLAVALLLLPILALAWSPIDSARRALIVPTLPEVNSYVLVETETETVLASENSDAALASASLSKLMTSYLAAEALGSGRITSEQSVRVSENAWLTSGSRMFLEHRDLVSVDQLLRGLIVQSGNDAATALAELIGGNEDSFAFLMNATAQRLGLRSSRFFNSTGLDHPDGTNVMSARDVAILLKQLISQYGDFYQRYYSQKSYTYNNITQPNRNRLLWSDEPLFQVDGGKTGYTDAAGYSLAASGVGDSMRLIAVVMGSASESQRVAHVKTLLAHGFSYYDKRLLFSEDHQWQPVRIWQGSQDYVNVGLRSRLAVLFPRGQFEDLSANLRISSEYPIAPVANGQPIGYISVNFARQEILRHPLYAAESVGRANTFKLWRDRARIWLMQKNLL